MTEAGFDLYCAIDWSGAKGERHKGIQMALAEPGRGVPRLLDNPFHGSGRWSRTDVLRWLTETTASGRRVLAGFDFAFAYPYLDAGSYFPGLEGVPTRPAALWQRVEEVCRDDDDFYGGAFYLSGDLPYRDYFWAHPWRGPRYAERKRRTELAAREVAPPHPVFKCFGPANVGTGSLAGMRFLHALISGRAGQARVWPIADPADAALVVVEIYPRLYFRTAGANPTKFLRHEAVLRTLEQFGADDGVVEEPSTEDEADALVSAAALRSLAGRPAVWRPASASAEALAREGWIFGVE